MITVKAPGKLYIAGEYAVLEHGHPAVIAAINQYLTAQIQPSSDHNFGTITSIYSHNQPLIWYRKQGQAQLQETNNDFRYIITAINLAEAYVKAMGKPLSYFNLQFISSLDDNGTKYGFGSSGAVTVATIKAVLSYYQIPFTHDLIYKLSVLTQLELRENGSFGDIAASTYGGWIAYSTFDRKWLLNKMDELPLTELLHTQWSDLRIEPLPKPDLDLVIGWTGIPSSTSNLVDQVKDDLHHHTISPVTFSYEDFLTSAKQIVEKLIQAFYQNDTELICQKVDHYYHLLLKFAQMTNINLETKQLKTLTSIANELNIIAKPSGAGGGDCGIALVKPHQNSQQLTTRWEQNGIVPLTNINVYFENN